MDLRSGLGSSVFIYNGLFSAQSPDSKTLFETPQNLRIIMKEREDALIPCLLTDPAATHVQFHMENGSAPPPDMNITFDPKKGMLIQSLQLWFSSKYVCSARIGGVEKVSPAITLQVTPSKCLYSLFSIQTELYFCISLMQ